VRRVRVRRLLGLKGENMTGESGYQKKMRIRRERYRVLRDLEYAPEVAREVSQNSSKFEMAVEKALFEQGLPPIQFRHLLSIPRIPRAEWDESECKRRERYHLLRKAGLNAHDASNAATGVKRTEAVLAQLQPNPTGSPQRLQTTGVTSPP
jgi:hypothetical protein